MFNSATWCTTVQTPIAKITIICLLNDDITIMAGKELNPNINFIATATVLIAL